jgi:YidC/Oxa1 family membrane protein insertase
MFGGILSAIGVIFGKLMYFIYNTIGFHNYALSLVFFTIVYKLIMLPLSIKQIKSTQKMQEIQPELQRIQERYKNDREKLNEMTIKLYQEKGYSPTSGCLPLFIQFPIIIALFFVIRMPLTYMFEIPAYSLGQMVIASVEKGTFSKDTLREKNYDAISYDPRQVYDAYNKNDSYFEIKLIDSYKKHPEILENNDTLTPAQKEVLRRYNIKLLGIFNLGTQPVLDFNKIIAEPGVYIPAWILLLIAVFTTYLTSLFMMPNAMKKRDKSGKDRDKNTNAGCANKSMLYMSPIMTFIFGTAMPSGLAFYWSIQSVLSYIQHILMNRIYKKDKEEKQVAKIDSKRG